MKLTTLSRYGVRSIFDIAYYGAGNPTKASQISLRQGISLNYIGQIFLRLKKAGLLKSHRGRSGGYFLAFDPDEITIKMIIEAVEGNINLVNYKNNESDCPHKDSCVTSVKWKEASNILSSYFSSITIKDLMDDAEKRGFKRDLN
jgi:Rrf2 family protein